MPLDKKVIEYYTRKSPICDVKWNANGKNLTALVKAGKRYIFYRVTRKQKRTIYCTHNVFAGMSYGGGEFASTSNHIYFIQNRSRLVRYSHIKHKRTTYAKYTFDAIASPFTNDHMPFILFAFSEGKYEGIAAQWKNEKRKCVILFKTLSSVRDPQFNSQILSWISWKNPHMPWQESRLMRGEIRFDSESITLENVRPIFKQNKAAVYQWDGTNDPQHVYYSADCSGRINIYRYHILTSTHFCIVKLNKDIGFPQWVCGIRTIVFDNIKHQLYFLASSDGGVGLWKKDLKNSALPIMMRGLRKYPALEQIELSPKISLLALQATAVDEPKKLILYDTRRQAVQKDFFSYSKNCSFDSTRADHIKWMNREDKVIYGVLRSPKYTKKITRGIVYVHSGPTTQSLKCFDPVELFTKEGFYVLQVNYRGSSGYGKSYRSALNGHWGHYDVEDCVSAAEYLVKKTPVHPDHIAIVGGSSGGYTALKSIINFPNVFCKVIVSYPVCDLIRTSQATHKFEKHYFDSLIGPFRQNRKKYKKLSPINNIDKIRCPILVFQGKKDGVVSYDDTAQFVEKVKKAGGDIELISFADEGHGFKDPVNLKKYYQTSVNFLCKSSV